MFSFDEAYLKEFQFLKENLTSDPIIVAPNQSKPFEVMNDVNIVVLGALLGQMQEIIFHPTLYASKGLNGAQKNYFLTYN